MSRQPSPITWLLLVLREADQAGENAKLEPQNRLGRLRSLDGLRQRILKKVEKKECWLWRGFKNEKGYGKLSITRNGKQRSMLVHRLSYAVFNGTDPGRLCVLHKCDTPSCCNPDHLFLGTKGDNQADAASKNRLLYGSRNPASKLTEEKVREMRDIYARGEMGSRRLGKKFGISRQMALEIVQGKWWKRAALSV